MEIKDFNAYIRFLRSVKGTKLQTYVASLGREEYTPEWIEESKGSRWRIENALYICKIYKIFNVMENKEEVDGYVAVKREITSLLGYDEGVIITKLGCPLENLDNMKELTEKKFFYDNVPNYLELDAHMIHVTRLLSQDEVEIEDEIREYLLDVIESLEDIAITEENNKEEKAS